MEQLLGRREPWRAAPRRELQGDPARAAGVQPAEAPGQAVWGQDEDRDGQGARDRNPIAVNKVQAQVCVWGGEGGGECRHLVQGAQRREAPRHEVLKTWS